MIDKIKFSQIGEVQFAKNPLEIKNLNKKVVFKTIQITSLDPSNFTMVIRRADLNGVRFSRIPLADYRTKFIFQNGKYLLNIGSIAKFQEEGSWSRVEVSFESTEQFESLDIEIYFSMINVDVPIKIEMTSV